MKGYKHMTDAEQAEIVRLYQELGHTRLVQERTGQSYSKVVLAISRAGIQPHGGRAGACYKNRGAVERMAKCGASLSSIAREIGTNKKTVRRFLSRFLIERTPHVQSGVNNPSWKGGRMIDKHGYVLIHRPDHPHANRHGYVREHRLVMEKKLGRLLLRTEVVHHDPEVEKSDNRPEVLFLYQSNADHLRDELKGKIPRWTEDGKRRISEGTLRPKPRKASAIRSA